MRLEMDPLKRFVLTLRLRNTKYMVMEQCALFARVIGGRVVKGWACTGGEACQHYWVEHGGQTYDVGRAYTLLFEPALAHVETKLVTTLDEGAKTIGDDEPVVKRNLELYELYTNDLKEFWKGVKKFKYSPS